MIDTGATYVALNESTARRLGFTAAGLDFRHAVNTANGQAKAKLTKADKVALGKLEAINVPVAVQVEDKGYGPGIDGLLGMSFLSRFEVQMADGVLEVRTRQPKK